MKRIFKLTSLFIVIAMLLTSSLSFSTVYAGEDETEEEKPLYLALGDSITYGYAPTDDPAEVMTGRQLTDECFVNILAKEKGYRVVNKGVLGNTAVGVKAQIATGELDEYIKEAQIITLTCGGNDLMEVVYTRAANIYNANKTCVEKWGTIESKDIIFILGLASDYDADFVTSVKMACYAGIIGADNSTEFKEALEQFIVDLNDLTATIKSINPDVKIYFATQYNPFEHYVGTYKAISTYIGNCAKILHDREVENAEAGQYTIVDVYSAFLGNTASYCNATEDPLYLDFHPSIAGHAAIAACFSEVVPQAEIKVKPAEETKTPNTGEDLTIYLATVSMIVSAATLSFVEKKKKSIA